MDSPIKKLSKKYNLQDKPVPFIFSFREGYILTPLGFCFLFEKIAHQELKKHELFKTIKKYIMHFAYREHPYSYEYPDAVILELINNFDKKYLYQFNVITMCEVLIDSEIKILCNQLESIFNTVEKNYDAF